MTKNPHNLFLLSSLLPYFPTSHELHARGHGFAQVNSDHGRFNSVKVPRCLNKKMQDAKVEHDKPLLPRKIEATDATIDKLVYELYGLMEEGLKSWRVMENETER